jgi:exodeoxyribonuclease V alpha subunit
MNTSLTDLVKRLKAGEFNPPTSSTLPSKTISPKDISTLPPKESQNTSEKIEESKENIIEDIQIIKEDSFQTYDKYGKVISYNKEQQQIISLAASGESCVLIGPAGTGKTTSMNGATTAIIQSGKAGILDSQGHKYLHSGTPGIVIVAYTRRAVANIRKNLPKDLQSNAITCHKLLEYEPVYNEVEDPTTGGFKRQMSFEPTRNAGKPLPPSIKVIIFEETSMLGVDLYKEVMAACHHNVQFVFLGDIQQLPPVFGPAILGFKLLSLPVVELTQVYRQALESPIISLAHRILSGKAIPAKDIPSFNVPSKLTIKPWKKKISPDEALNTVALMFCGNKHKESDPKKQATGLHEGGYYDPEEDMILMPFGKAFGTEELNKHIANYLAKSRGAEVYQIIGGFEKHYFSVGDKVMYEKEDATIIKIEKNLGYTGMQPVPHSKTLDYWGMDSSHTQVENEEMSEDAMDFLLSQVASGDPEDRVRKCSHVLTLRMNDSEAEIKIDTASAINSLLLGYALTVHKAQGSEWRKVFFILHQSHNTMIQRELLYTGVTRAREELFIVCEPETFTKGIESQRVKGNTLAEKAEFFKGKLSAGFVLDC